MHRSVQRTRWAQCRTIISRHLAPTACLMSLHWSPKSRTGPRCITFRSARQPATCLMKATLSNCSHLPSTAAIAACNHRSFGYSPRLEQSQQRRSCTSRLRKECGAGTAKSSVAARMISQAVPMKNRGGAPAAQTRTQIEQIDTHANQLHPHAPTLQLCVWFYLLNKEPLRCSCFIAF